MRLRPPATIDDILTLAVTGILSCVLFAFLMPHMEQGRGEARMSHAWLSVRDLSDKYSDGAIQPGDQIDEKSFVIRDDKEDLRTQADPWGMPYRLVLISGGQGRVLSCGPNSVTSSNGVDDDDIYSDMPASPMEPFRQRRRRQWFVAVAVPICCWLSVAGIHLSRT